MKLSRGSKVILSVIGIFAIIIAGGFIYINSTSGLDSPLSVIMSSSMQHDNYESSIGTIDTGDVMIIKSPEKVTIYSYVEGTINGYRSFGDYGSVIIYERGDDVNPVIHRAIVWLDYNNGKWSCPSLANYKGLWSCPSSNNDYMNLRGTLTFTDVTQSRKTVSINLDDFTDKNRHSGYLTMGDNPVTNTYFDQSAGIISHPIGSDDIRAVAVHEIPWMGVIKVYMTENKKAYLEHVPNSVNSLIMLFVMVFAVIYCCDFYHTHNENMRKRAEIEKYLQENY